MENPIDIEILGPELVRSTFRRMLADMRQLRIVDDSARVRLLLGMRWLPEPADESARQAGPGPQTVLVVRDPARELPPAWGAGVRAFVCEEDPATVVLAAITAAAVEGWFVSPVLSQMRLSFPPTAKRSGRGPAQGLTRRQELVLGLFDAGNSYKEIAAQLHVDVETIRSHLKRARRK